MKVKSTKNGNVKIVLSPEQARHVYQMCNFSGQIKYPVGVSTSFDAVERTSDELHSQFFELGYRTHG